MGREVLKYVVMEMAEAITKKYPEDSHFVHNEAHTKSISLLLLFLPPPEDEGNTASPHWAETAAEEGGTGPHG